MNLDYLYSDDVHSFFRSPVRDIFKNYDMDRIISFAGGYPSPETFPLSEIRKIMDEVMEQYGGKALQYGATQGVLQLREAIAARYGVDSSRVQITTSSQQGIDVCTRIFVNPGDVVLTTSPAYLGALQSFRSYRADVRGVERGIPAGEAFDRAAEQALSEGKRLKFIYIIPDFQNPSGETLDYRERKAVVEVARKYSMAVVEDSPYRELRYEGEAVPTIYSIDPDIVLHLGSFSKIFAPGFRLGWILGNPDVLDKIAVCKQSLDLCPPVFDQYVAAGFIRSGILDSNLKKSIALYRSKRDLMLSLLERHMPDGVRWTHPEGGLFLFLEFPEGFDSVDFYGTALSNGIAYVAGSFFYPQPVRGNGRGDCRQGCGNAFRRPGANTMRLNFSFMPPEKIEEGIIRLSELAGEYMRENGIL